MFYVIKGQGYTDSRYGRLAWGEGDLFTLPVNEGVTHAATEDTVMYWVSDAPVLNYLGAQPSRPTFEPTHYSRAWLMQNLQDVRNADGAYQKNRTGILLGNAACEQTKTLTPTLWSLLNVLPPKTVQRHHRHNSIALDLCVSAGPDTYTLLSQKLDKDGELLDPIRADWKSGGMFVTPPGWWHSHHNESGDDALVLPIQDAGLVTNMQILDIQFRGGATKL